MEKLHFAKAVDESKAKVIIFGANSNQASHAPSFQTTSQVDRTLFSADFARQAENESPALSEKMIDGNHVYDAGNIALPDDKQDQVNTLSESFKTWYEQNKVPVCLGGDHLIKFAGIKQFFEKHPDGYVIYLDAHPDCHMTDKLYYGSILHHVFQAEAVKPAQVILTGLRQANAIEKLGYDHYAMPTIFSMDFSLFSSREIYEKMHTFIPKKSPVYFSMDLDGLDPADTPGVEQPCPGGPRVNDMIALMTLMSEEYRFAGMDVSEFLPAIDHQKLTALVMMRLVKEFCALVR